MLVNELLDRAGVQNKKIYKSNVRSLLQHQIQQDVHNSDALGFAPKESV